jgi:hypothetical protein
MGKVESERHISHIFYHIWNIDIKTNKRHEYKRGTFLGGSSGRREGNKKLLGGK